MTDFEKARILTKIAGKDCYISRRYRLSSEMRSVNGGGKADGRGGDEDTQAVPAEERVTLEPPD